MACLSEKLENMKADRLIATLLILQRRGTATSSEIAEELEVSERTARRDLDALAMAGIPVYSRQGRGGGWSLIGGAKTDLSGLTEAEARALFLVAGPSSSASKETRAALRKLVQALPETFRAEAEAVSAAVKIDSSSWGRSHISDPEFLEPLQTAAIKGAEIILCYSTPNKEPSERVVQPLGLVSKRGVWYMIGDTLKGRRTFRVGRVAGVELTGERFERPRDFDLDAAWQDVVSSVGSIYSGLRVHCLVEPRMLAPLRSTFAAQLQILGSRPDGRLEVELRAGSVPEAAGRLGGFGGSVQVIDPPEVIVELKRIAEELIDLYEQ